MTWKQALCEEYRNWSLSLENNKGINRNRTAPLKDRLITKLLVCKAVLLVKSAWTWTIQRKFILHYSIGSKAARDNVNQIAHVPKSRGSLGNNKHGGWSCDGVHSGLHSPGRWNSAICYWNDSWVQTFHILCILFIQIVNGNVLRHPGVPGPPIPRRLVIFCFFPSHRPNIRKRIRC